MHGAGGGGLAVLMVMPRTLLLAYLLYVMDYMVVSKGMVECDAC